MKLLNVDIPSLGDFPLSLELKGVRSRGDEVLAVVDSDLRTPVDELGGDVSVGVGRVLRLHHDAVGGTARRGGVDRQNGLQLGVGSIQAGGDVAGGGHFG